MTPRNPGGNPLPRFRELHDISIPLTPSTPAWPGDPRFRVTPIRGIDRGDGYTLSELRLGTHTGTHIDAPRHVFEEGAPVHRTPLEVLCGPARVLDLRGWERVDGPVLRAVWPTVRQVGRPPGLEEEYGALRVLLKTDGSARWLSDPAAGGERAETFLTEGFPGLTEDAAEFLVGQGVRLVGIDGPSIDAPGPGLPAHRRLLGAGVVVVECLDLSPVEAGPWFLCCLPLAVFGLDGAPARAILARG